MTGQGPKRAVVKIHATCNTSWLKKTSMWGRSKRRRIDRPTLKHTASEELVSACLNKWDILYRLLDRDSRFSEDKPSFKKISPQTGKHCPYVILNFSPKLILMSPFQVRSTASQTVHLKSLSSFCKMAKNRKWQTCYQLQSGRERNRNSPNLKNKTKNN